MNFHAAFATTSGSSMKFSGSFVSKEYHPPSTNASGSGLERQSIDSVLKWEFIGTGIDVAGF